MKRVFKTLLIFLLWAVALPALAALGVMLLWNAVVPALCGFAAIGFWQAVGLFFLGQLLSAGFVLGIFLLGAGIHGVVHHDVRRMHSHWHKMSADERRAFFERRRAWMEGHD